MIKAWNKRMKRSKKNLSLAPLYSLSCLFSWRLRILSEANGDGVYLTLVPPALCAFDIHED